MFLVDLGHFRMSLSVFKCFWTFFWHSGKTTGYSGRCLMIPTMATIGWHIGGIAACEQQEHALVMAAGLPTVETCFERCTAWFGAKSKRQYIQLDRSSYTQVKPEIGNSAVLGTREPRRSGFWVCCWPDGQRTFTNLCFGQQMLRVGTNFK